MCLKGVSDPVFWDSIASQWGVRRTTDASTRNSDPKRGAVFILCEAVVHNNYVVCIICISHYLYASVFLVFEIHM